MRGLIVVFLLLPLVVALQIPLRFAGSSLDPWLATEIPYARDGVLNNIGSRGAKATGAVPGAVIASPSTHNPNYFYTWTRDAALTIKCLVDTLAHAPDPLLHRSIQEYIALQASLQTVATPSGDLATGGLGEPKFYADQTTPFTGPWGRPQRDGPALRASAIIAYAEWLLDHGHVSTAESLWPIVRNDLSYVTEYWNASTYDIWEELNTSPSLFTTLVQYRALISGATLAHSLNHTCPNCISQAPQILCLLQTFWSKSDGFMRASHDPHRSGKDASAMLAAVHAFDPAAACDDRTFQPCSPRALATHKAVVDSFRALYPINYGVGVGRAVAVGRYAEDGYQGGHPWYLCTLAAAQQLYLAVGQWKSQGWIGVTEVDLGFWRDVWPAAEVGRYYPAETVFGEVVDAVLGYADGFMRVVFSRDDGAPLSATDLTWSYVALLTTAAARTAARENEVGTEAVRTAPPPSLPDVCVPTSAKGPYVPATANISWPVWPCPGSPVLPVRFNVRVETVVGEEVFVVGSVPALGDWDVRRAVRLAADEYGAVPLWYAVVELRAGQRLEYKFVKRGRSGAGDVVWEDGFNRELSVEDECLGVVTVNAVWGLTRGGV